MGMLYFKLLNKRRLTIDYIITHQPCEMIMKQLSDNPLDFNYFTHICKDLMKI